MIKSFKIDHKNLNKGIYVSSIKTVGDIDLVTFDIRVRRPYRDAVMTSVCAHTIEHIMADGLEGLFDKIPNLERVYFGPMGCMTGFYLVVASKGTMKVSDCRDLMLAIMSVCGSAIMSRQIPGNSEDTCGNCNTLKYTQEVEDCLKVIKGLANKVVLEGRPGKYPMLSESKVVIETQTVYTIRYPEGDIKVVGDEKVTKEEIENIVKGRTYHQVIDYFRKMQ